MSLITIDIATEFKGKKAFDQAGKSTTVLEKSVKRLGKQIAAVFAVRQVVAFGKASFKAYAEMEAQQDRLAKLMKVGTGATASQIQSLNNQAAALENLGVVSKGNITQTQSQLATFNLQASTIEKLTPAILDYVTAEKGAAASTDQFKQMTNGLAQALNGNFASLTKTGFVIDDNTKSIIKNGKESERAEAIVKVLNSTYKGFNKSLRDTPIGQLQLLNNAADDARETIGKGLLDALVLLGGNGADGIQKATDKMNDLSVATADVIRGQAVLLKNLGEVGNGTLGKIGNAIRIYFKEVTGIQGLQDLGASTRPRPRANRDVTGRNNTTLYSSAEAKAKKLEQDRLKIAKLQTDLQKKQTAELKRQAITKKQSALFDLEQIQLVAALQGKLSQEDRDRVKLQLALLTGNTAEADRLVQKVALSIDKTGELAAYLKTLPDAKNPFLGWDTWLINFTKNLAAVTGSKMSPDGGLMPANNDTRLTNVPVNYDPRVSIPEPDRKLYPGQMQYGARTTQPSVVVHIDGKEIAAAVLNQSLNGVSSIDNRLNGSFK